MRKAWQALLCVCLVACGGGESADDGKGEPKAGSGGGAAAAGEGGAGEGGGAAANVQYLSPTQHLVRASMALRGLRPSLQELEAVQKNPKYVEAIVDYYLGTPEFGETMRELHAEVLLVGVDPILYPAGFPARGALSGMTMQELNRSIVDAPLRLIEHVIMEDRPYSEIVTADYTLADRTVATVWGMPYNEGGETWQETTYQDKRPTAGILSDSFVFTRHSTTFSNKSRGRANLVSRALLCYDFLSRELPIDTSIDLADEAAVTMAVKNNPTCSACHTSLDPLAAYFAPFRPIYLPSDIAAYPYSTYVPSYQEPFSVTDPGFFGEPGKNVVDLGQAIAEDPRFARCAAEHFYTFLSQVDPLDAPAAVIEALQAEFIDRKMSAKALAKAVVMSDEFRASHADTDEDAEHLVGLKKASPEALARMFEDLTGFRWETTLALTIPGYTAPVGDVDLMNDGFFGFKVLAGGIDGQSVTRPSHTMSATVTLALQGLASRAAKHVVEGDLDTTDKAKRRLLTSFDPANTSEAAVRAQLAELSLRLYGDVVAADSTELDAAYTLFTEALSNGLGAERAMTVTLYAMLQDPRMVYY
jgi:Protein of unknown function (DUF1585)/Protein of unknown function (DUF1588)